MMNPQYSTVHSPDEEGYYAEFWDGVSGKDILLDGERLVTDVFSERYRANKAAKRILRETDWISCTLA